MSNLKIELNSAEILDSARKTAEAEAIAATKRQVYREFSTRNNWGQADGRSTKKIERIVDEYIDSPEFDAACQRVIRELIDEKARNAISALLASRSRKSFFEQVPHE